MLALILVSRIGSLFFTPVNVNKAGSLLSPHSYPLYLQKTSKKFHQCFWFFFISSWHLYQVIAYLTLRIQIGRLRLMTLRALLKSVFLKKVPLISWDIYFVALQLYLRCHIQLLWQNSVEKNDNKAQMSIQMSLVQIIQLRFYCYQADSPLTCLFRQITIKTTVLVGINSVEFQFILYKLRLKQNISFSVP